MKDDDSKTTGIDIDKSEDVEIIKPTMKNLDTGVEIKSSKKVRVIEPKIANKQNERKNLQFWIILLGSLAAVGLLVLAVYESFFNIPEENEQKTQGSAGIRIEDSQNVTTEGNIIAGYQTGISVKNSSNFTSINDTIIKP